MPKFKEGDVVMLRSEELREQSIYMTIEYVSNQENPIRCIWFDINGRLQKESFFKQSLIMIKENKS